MTRIILDIEEGMVLTISNEKGVNALDDQLRDVAGRSTMGVEDDGLISVDKFLKYATPIIERNPEAKALSAILPELKEFLPNAISPFRLINLIDKFKSLKKESGPAIVKTEPLAKTVITEEILSDFPKGVHFLHSPEVKDWPVTSHLNVVLTKDKVALEYDKSSVWPNKDIEGGVNANPWVIAEVDGQSYAGTWEWMRKGQESKKNVIRGDHVGRPPLDGDWKPRKGERIGIFVSGLARSSVRNVEERTNVVWVEAV